MNNEFSPTESLSIIQGMINKAQNRFAENGFLYLLWGWVVFFCAVIQFVCYKFNLLKNPEIIWALTWLVVFYQIYYLAKKEKAQKVKTYTDELIGYVWMVFGFSMFIVGFVTGKNNHWQSMYALFIGLYGMPTFLSGAIMKFTPLKVGAICCWILAIVATYVQPIYCLLLLALGVVVAWIIPGYLLQQKFKKENAKI